MVETIQQLQQQADKNFKKSLTFPSLRSARENSPPPAKVNSPPLPTMNSPPTMSSEAAATLEMTRPDNYDANVTVSAWTPSGVFTPKTCLISFNCAKVFDYGISCKTYDFSFHLRLLFLCFPNAAAEVRAPTEKAFVIGLLKSMFSRKYLATHSMKGITTCSREGLKERGSAFKLGTFSHF